MIGPDIVACQLNLGLLYRLQSAFIFLQHTICLGVIDQGLVQAVQGQVRQTCPFLPGDLELAHGRNSLFFTLGDHADEVALDHDLDDAGQVGDGLFIDRDQAGAQRCRSVSAGIGRANHTAMQHAGHAQVVDIGQGTQHLVGNVHALNALADVLKARFAQLDLFVHFDLQVQTLDQFAIAKALAACNDHALLRGDALGGNTGFFAGQLDQQLTHLRCGVAHGQG